MKAGPAKEAGVGGTSCRGPGAGQEGVKGPVCPLNGGVQEEVGRWWCSAVVGNSNSHLSADSVTRTRNCPRVAEVISRGGSMTQSVDDRVLMDSTVAAAFVQLVPSSCWTWDGTIEFPPKGISSHGRIKFPTR